MKKQGNTVKVFFEDANVYEDVEVGTNLLSFVPRFESYFKSPIVAAKVDNEIKELKYVIHRDCKVKFIDMTQEDGMRIYRRSLIFVLIVATRMLFKETVNVQHSLSKGLYCEIENRKLTAEDINLIKQKMKWIVDQDFQFRREKVSKDDAVKLFEEKGFYDKARTIKFSENDYVYIYYCGDYVDYFYGHLVPSTGYLKIFNLIQYHDGMVLLYPDKSDPFKLQEFVENKKLFAVYHEYKNWGKILGVSSIGELNEVIASGKIREFIRVSEALHEKKIAYLADQISQNPLIKVVLISGPSSSGKTTFAQRLSIQLKVNGKNPVYIGLDDYFFEDKVPLDENGKPDYESIEAIDVELFNKQLKDLIDGKEVVLPRFNFIERKRTFERPVKLEKNDIIIIEGIHGLNRRLTPMIPDESKFKIYVSALTHLNLDKHNRIQTTDYRILRRIVRDARTRGASAKRTISMWPSVRNGEEKNIFPYQEMADAMFNSALIYELAVLKKYAVPLLRTITREDEEYSEAQRLLHFLSFILTIEDEREIPPQSIIREFIGGSCFYDF
ncbi:AAA ATPase [Caldicellulosiruptor kronotskyensis 2002]|uniref:AAA ATPase n=1 Tax=Caldicellulosiruptor kronotskyensis (strain DSM 18902 / VKM B-2412 / 2002) TaxID=632348 RepID=E4SGS0_CALK2|nr:nucleoside kinase [Caldicellulosiruptor kronotskyensis]ADQ46945.1 AAA ATPase [Caldicellulosiruptor kronotskyensis 2002]